MNGNKAEALRALCADGTKELARLEAELAQVHCGKGNTIDATGLAIAIGIRTEYITAIEKILERPDCLLAGTGIIPAAVPKPPSKTSL